MSKYPDDDRMNLNYRPGEDLGDEPQELTAAKAFAKEDLAITVAAMMNIVRQLCVKCPVTSPLTNEQELWLEHDLFGALENAIEAQMREVRNVADGYGVNLEWADSREAAKRKQQLKENGLFKRQQVEVLHVINKLPEFKQHTSKE